MKPFDDDPELAIADQAGCFSALALVLGVALFVMWMAWPVVRFEVWGF